MIYRNSSLFIICVILVWIGITISDIHENYSVYLMTPCLFGFGIGLLWLRDLGLRDHK